MFATAIIAFLIGLALAAIPFWRLLIQKNALQKNWVEEKNHHQQTQTEWVEQLAQTKAVADRVPALEQQLRASHDELMQQREKAARQEQAIHAAKQRHEETDKLLAETRKAMGQEFSLLANKLLEEKGASLGKQQQERLDNLLKPFSENLKDFRSKVEKAREDDIKARTGLIEQIRHLTELNQDIGAKAQSLTNALRGENKAQGIWGEQVLRRLLELAGLREGINFRTQAVHKSEQSNKRLIPDVVLDLPDNRAIIIDSKVSLVAYERYGEAGDDEQARAQALKEHCHSIKRHIKELSKKNYPALYGMETVDFTLLFIPIESALMVASQADSSLTQLALEKHIALVSPNTLFTVLRTVEYIWRVEKTTRNMNDIVKRGAMVYDKACQFGEYMVAINDTLNKAKASAEKAEKALADPSRGLMRQAERLKTLGITSKKNMPKRLATREDTQSDSPNND